jgi:hypothetical protein
MTIEKLFCNRSFIKHYTDTAPPEELVHELINKTYNLVPSKQNLVPYSLNIFGPNCVKEKSEILQRTKRDYHETNPNAQLLAPYVIIFTSRLAKPNKWVESLIKKGHKYNSCNKDKFLSNRTLRDVLLEIGMFSTILTGLCLEQDIDTAYTLCQYSKSTEQNLFKGRALFIMSLGYRKYYYTREWRKQFYEKRGEIKPKIEDIIIWK